MFIYLITNKINGKKYVGQTTKDNPYVRFKEHLTSAKMGSPYPIHAAIRKYGVASFSFELLETGCSTQEQLDLSECFWIRAYESSNMLFGYNVFLGGSCGATNEVAKLKKSLKLKGRVFSEESRRKMSESGRKVAASRWTPERRALQSKKKMKGSNNPSFGKPFPGPPLSGTQAASRWIKNNPETHSANCIKASKKSWENLTELQKQERIAPMRKARWAGKESMHEPVQSNA